MNRPPLVLASWLVPALLAGSAAGAQVYVDDDATGANDGSSWTDAYTRLDVALDAADPGDEIWLAEGTYVPSTSGDRFETFHLASVTIYGGFVGSESSVDGRLGSVDATILSGDLAGDDGPGFGNRSDNSLHVLDVAIFEHAGLDRVTVRGGQADLPGQEYGGGLFSFLGDVDVVDCVFVDNYALENGGGAYTTGFADFLRTTFTENRASAKGGGLCAETWETAEPFVSHCRFVGNEVLGGAPTGEGGGLWCDGLVQDSELIGNRAPNGGGVRCYSAWGLTVVANSATQSTGGALLTYGQLRSSIVWGNSDPSGTGEAAQVSTAIGGVSESCVQGWTGLLGGARNIAADPLFVDPLGADGIAGTGDEDLAPGPGSPCIDRGEVPTWGAPATDLRGEPRVVDCIACGEDGLIDMGAIERQELDGSSNYCDAAPSSLGVPATLSIPCKLSLFLDDTLELRAGPVPAGLTVFVMSPEVGESPLGNGVLCLGPGLVRLAHRSSSGAVARVALDLHAPPTSDSLVAGSTWFVQAVYRDAAAGGQGFNLSDAASLEIRN